MAKKKETEFILPTLDDLFSNQEQRNDEGIERVQKIKTEMIDDFPNHPFKVRLDEEMYKMVDSIKQYGVLSPAIMRPKEDGRYEMVAGHRRKLGSELADVDWIPAIIRDMTDDEATILMVDSNLQREKLLPSEKAFAYKMKLEAMKRQGKRTDLTSVQLAQKLKGQTSRETLAKQVGESQDQIRRYIRLTHLIPELLKLVDDGKIGLIPAVEISYIPENLQKELLNAMEMEDCTPSLAQTKQLRRLLDEGNLTEKSIVAVMQQEKPNQKEKIILHEERVRKYIPKSIPIPKREEYIIKALEYYAKYREKQEQQVSR